MAEKQELTKDQYAAAYNEFWGTEIDWTKFSVDELKSLAEIWNGKKLDSTIERLFKYAPNPIKLFRKISVLRLDHAVEKRRSLFKDVADSDTPMLTAVLGIKSNIQEHTEMGGALSGGGRLIDLVKGAGGFADLLKGKKETDDD